MEHDLTVRFESERKLEALGYVLRGSFHTDTYLLDLIVQLAERVAETSSHIDRLEKLTRIAEAKGLPDVRQAQDSQP